MQQYCIPSSANSRSTKFNSRIFKSFCVMYDEETINGKQLNPSQDHPTLGFRVSKSFLLITVLGFCEGFCFVVEGEIVLSRRGGRRGLRRWR
jgi:hypothetical protein